MTGRAAGPCVGYPVPGFMGPSMGRGPGFGRGFGRGRGWGRGYVAPTPVAPTRDQELDALKGQAEHLSQTLESVKERITQLEKDGGA
jgi:Family of unknown function (DUF5320)